MARAPSTFRQGDVTRAIRATQAAGVDIAKIVVAPDGTITIIAGNPAAVEADDLDCELAAFQVRHGQG
jgi:hypothetical protein